MGGEGLGGQVLPQSGPSVRILLSLLSLGPQHTDLCLRLFYAHSGDLGRTLLVALASL